MSEDNKVCRAGLDYESEYKRLRAEKEKLEQENRYLKDQVSRIENDARVMRGKINMVELIFGGLNR